MTKSEQYATTSATTMGYGGVLLWTISPVLASAVVAIPAFEIISVAFTFSFIFTAIYLTVKKRWHILKQPKLLWIVGILGIFGNDALYLAAFKYAPPVHVDLINYLWPILIILFAGLLPREKFTLKHLIAGLVGFYGVYVLITHGQGLVGLHKSYFPGYLLALAEAVIWSVYTLVARHYKQTPPEAIGIYCGVGALSSLLIHFSYEATVIPNLSQWGIMIFMGLFSQGLAYFLWEIGIKRGNFKLLSVLAYGNPILSVGFLALFGYTHLTNTILTASLLVTAGGIIASLNPKGSSLNLEVKSP